MNCTNTKCGAPIPANMRICPACGRDAGAPNVRKADEPAEVAAVELRYSEQREKASAGGYLETFVKFEEAISASIAVIRMPPMRLLSLSSDPSSILSTFSLQVAGQSRVPQDNRFDALRSSVENAYFPNYSEDVRFGALSLSDIGHIAYGSCSLSLKESAISSRTSVFELPLFKFSQQYKVCLAEEVPPGHRASWTRRARLAAAKLGSKLGAAGVDFADLLLPAPTDTLSDCIEVNIFGPLNRYSIEKVVMTLEKRREDKIMQRAIVENLNREGIQVRVAT